MVTIVMMYRIDSSKKDSVLLWLDTLCGIKQPLMRWADLNDLKHFATSLIE
jgi:hypothetical protein